MATAGATVAEGVTHGDPATDGRALRLIQLITIGA